MNRLSMLSLLFLVQAAEAANWPTWRGPTFDGVAPAGDYPTQWSGTENIAWKAALPGRGSSTPIVWDRQIFLTYGKGGQNVLASFDWSGKPQWEVALGAEKPGKHKVYGSGSNPSPVTDGKSVFAYFKSGDLACVDFAGKIRWQKNLQNEYGEDSLWWDLGTSPVLTRQHVVATVMQTGPSYLVALNKETGTVAWKHDRNVEAPSEAAQSYSTPIVITESDAKETIYVLGADHVTAHSGADGKELWRVGGLNPTNHGFFRSISSPVLSGETLIAPYARGASVTAIKLGGSGDVTKSHVAWFKDPFGADVPTPAARNGRVFVCSDRGDVTCVDGKTGSELWKVQLEKARTPFRASPILAGENLFLTREDGKTFVLAQADGKQLAANELPGEFVVATPVFVDGRILIRSNDNLYCIGK